MTQKCPADEIGNNYFSRRSHILMSLSCCPCLPATLQTLITYWSAGFHISQLPLSIGQILFCFGSIECFYSDTSRWPTDNCNFLCVILFGGKFWFVCNYIWGTLIIFRIVSTWSSQTNFIQRVRWHSLLALRTKTGQGCSEWVFPVIPSHYYGDYNRCRPSPESLLLQ